MRIWRAVGGFNSPVRTPNVLSFWHAANPRIAAQRSALRESLLKPQLFATPLEKTTLISHLAVIRPATNWPGWLTGFSVAMLLS